MAGKSAEPKMVRLRNARGVEVLVREDKPEMQGFEPAKAAKADSK